LGGLNLEGLRAQGLVPATVADQPLTGDALAISAGGYLHANCGHCHNPNGAAWAKSNMTLRLSYGATNVPTSALYTSTVGVSVESYANKGYDFRIDPGSPARSAIVHRMGARDGAGGTQMPPIATELVDAEGVQKVSDWIASLPP
jgi:mono/diheme cytochrome c family protein